MNALVAAYQNDWQLRDSQGNQVAYPGAGPEQDQKPAEYARTVMSRVRKNSAKIAAGFTVSWPERLNDLRFDYYRGRHYYRPTATSQTVRLLPYRRIMASVLEFPSSDAVKVLTHVKEWLEEELTRSAARGRRLEDRARLLADVRQFRCALYLGDAGVADWVKHAIKFAWLRMHKDFLLQPPKRHSTCTRIRSRMESRSAGDAECGDQLARVPRRQNQTRRARN